MCIFLEALSSLTQFSCIHLQEKQLNSRRGQFYLPEQDMNDLCIVQYHTHNAKNVVAV